MLRGPTDGCCVRGIFERRTDFSIDGCPSAESRKERHVVWSAVERSTGRSMKTSREVSLTQSMVRREESTAVDGEEKNKINRG